MAEKSGRRASMDRETEQLMEPLCTLASIIRGYIQVINSSSTKPLCSLRKISSITQSSRTTNSRRLCCQELRSKGLLCKVWLALPWKSSKGEMWITNRLDLAASSLWSSSLNDFPRNFHVFFLKAIWVFQQVILLNLRRKGKQQRQDCSPWMKGIETTCPIGNSISHDVRCEESNANVEQGSCTNMKEIVEDKFQELCDNEDSSDGGKEIGTVTDGVLYVQNSHDRFPRENKVSNPDGIAICEEPGCSNSFDATVLKCLCKSATFPSYEVDSSHSNLETFAPVQGSSEDYVPEYKRSLSIPVRPSKLVSAMKGGRVQNRTLPKMDMHVKWAADVYDPPSTLVSHTVKNNYHHCPKPKKKNTYKHNHKGKSSPGKKFQNRKNGGSISEPYAARFKVSPCNEAAESSTDSKCGSIVFLRESLANFHLSIGEAT